MNLYQDQNFLLKPPHTRKTDFFLKKNFKDLTEDLEQNKIKEISDIELECLGYGIFDKDTVLSNFVKYTLDILTSCAEEKAPVKTFKLLLSGFQLVPEKQILVRIGKEIVNIRENLKVLWLHTSQLKNVTLRDFEFLLRLSVQLTDVNFQVFSFQCSNWKFLHHQPSFKDLEKIFTALVESSSDLQAIKNKHFRLEMSGWYYQAYQAKHFLGIRLEESEVERLKLVNSKYEEGLKYEEGIWQKEVQRFHDAMQGFLKALLNCMDQIQQFELDMRNWNQILKMKNLKKKLDNVTKQNRYETSIVIKRIDIQADEAQKELKLVIVM